MDTLKITWEMEEGATGSDDDPDNPISRALRKLFTDGQPFVRFTQCLCADRRLNNDRPILRWLGVFILSAGGRIIFFPGFQSRAKYIEGFRGNDEMWKKAFDFDHISIEKGFCRWHITSRGSKLHLEGPKTTNIGDQRFLWFGLSVNNLDELRIVKQKTRVIADSPESDVRRRYEVFSKARAQAVFQILEWHPDVWEQNSKGFWHLGLLVVPSHAPTYLGGTLGFPEGSPYLAEPLPKEQIQLPVRHHRMQLSSDIGLQVTTAFVPGSLRVPVTLTAPHET